MFGVSGCGRYLWEVVFILVTWIIILCFDTAELYCFLSIFEFLLLSLALYMQYISVNNYGINEQMDTLNFRRTGARGY